MARFQRDIGWYKQEQSAKNRLHILRLSTTTTSFSMLLTIIMQKEFPDQFGCVMGEEIVAKYSFRIILSVTEVNAMLAYKHFCKEEVDGMLGFRKLLAEALVYNRYYKEEESPRRSSRLTKNAEHRVFRLPKGKKFFGTEVVDVDSSHPQSTCVDCTRKIQTCCI